MCIHGRCRVETFGRLADKLARQDVDVEHAFCRLSLFRSTKLRLALRG